MEPKLKEEATHAASPTAMLILELYRIFLYIFKKIDKKYENIADRKQGKRKAYMKLR
jgi:hypothetical protein